MSDQISQLKSELDQVKRQLTELRERFENHLKDPIFEKEPRLRPSPEERRMG
jgi:hypothetical protein